MRKLSLYSKLTTLFIALGAIMTSCKSDHKPSPYQTCLYGDTEIKESSVFLNGVPVEFSNASAGVIENKQLNLFLETQDYFPFVFQLGVDHIGLNDSILQQKPKISFGLMDCDLGICGQFHDLFQGDTAYASLTDEGDIHVIIDARLINDTITGGSGCSPILGQRFDTARFQLNMVLNQD